MGVPSFQRQRKRWSSLVPIFAAIVVVAEIAFLSRMDMAKSSDFVQHWTNSFYLPYSSSADDLPLPFPEFNPLDSEQRRCEERLKREDDIPYSRDFTKDPVFISGVDEDWSSCSVGCKFGVAADNKPDAALGLPRDPNIAAVLRSMESSHYYAENNIDHARRKGFNIIMTTSLSSDVPVGYFSWAEYDIMAPMRPKTEDPIAAAFISNCGARNFRLQALSMLEKMDVKIGSYGSCHQNLGGNVNKVLTLRRYKFSLAFENSNEEDYVTEKFFQSLVAGAVPVVIGAPNIQDFAPSDDSILHIKSLDDVPLIAQKMKYLASNPEAFNHLLRWKYEGPSDSFKALLDMAAVHSSCRLCIHIATMIHQKEESNPQFRNRSCKCQSSKGTVYHLYVRERGRFKMESIFLRSDKLSLEELEAAVLQKFQSRNHTPIWKKERPESIRSNEYKIYRIYPVGMTQRQALYSFRFKDNAELVKYIESTPCAKLEAIFV
ncbi:hypothetical protein KFK09_024993 [Dendrobium nobile]|uniref:Fucosyltransferase n=1 Tax=Dendrobium nobile TaxID=94219 RepID=A0A8T3AFB5_DENNO|nr:hypothetical protein KFK09_024993 [Dendrobium nobile]